MRRIDYREWKKRRPERLRAILEAENKFEGRAPGRRPRDPDKERLLAEMSRRRREKLINTGKLQKIGPRHWKWRIGQVSRSA